MAIWLMCDAVVGCKHYLTSDCEELGPCEYCWYDPQCGCCIGKQKDCDDTNPCTTGDYCDLNTGSCVNIPVECPEGQTCNEEGQCE